MTQTDNAGIYCRLSRDEERTGESVSIENDRVLLTRYVQEQGRNLVKIYVDDGVDTLHHNAAWIKVSNTHKPFMDWILGKCRCKSIKCVLIPLG